jgi:WhiB family transcriptional regulator, redox-sensing transcriptional regulator
MHDRPGGVFSAAAWEWTSAGACRSADLTLFFPPDGMRGAERAARENAAKAICAGCPVRRPCREHALAVREPYGVWGGLTEDERAALVNRPGRAGPLRRLA